MINSQSSENSRDGAPISIPYTIYQDKLTRSITEVSFLSKKIRENVKKIIKRKKGQKIEKSQKKN